MSLSKQRSSSFQEAERFLSRSEYRFVEEYKKCYHGNAKSQDFYIFVLIKLENAIVSGNIGTFKRFVQVIDSISNIENQETLRAFYDDTQNPIRTTNLVILSCKYNRPEILKCILGNGKVLENLSVNVGKDVIKPCDKDESCHDAFYYAILSGNILLLEPLIKKWPGDYFTTRSEQLDEILSRAYEELRLKNVSLSASMEIFVENELINLRFFSNFSKKDQVSDKDQINSIMERVDLVLEKIDLLKSEYSDVEKFDEKFLFVTRFIAQNIHVLKRQLKVTYDRLPWEEIEFCLISFISSYLKEQEINLFYCAILNKNKILRYLVNFAEKLEAEKCHFNLETISKLAELPKLKRDQVVEEIIRAHPEFQDLYNDYQQIRDIHSLMKISEYLNLALSIDPNERQGQLIVVRVLQVIGEYLKNTLESPKLSVTTSELLVMSLPKNTRKIIIDLRNSLSHAYSLSRRTEIEENADVNFFTGVQNDTKAIYDVITDILFDKKIKMIRNLLQDIYNSETVDEIRGISKVLKVFKVIEISENDFKLMGHEKLEKLIREMNDAVTDKTYYEKMLFNRVDEILNVAKNESKNTISDYNLKFAILQSILHCFRIDVGYNIDTNSFRTLKYLTKTALQGVFSDEKPSYSLQEIVQLSMLISRSARSRLQGDNLDRVIKSTFEIFQIAESGVGDIKWIEKLRAKLYEKGTITVHKESQPRQTTKEQYNKQLTLKLSELKNILKNGQTSSESCDETFRRNKDKKFQAAVETLVLDILSILGESGKHLEDNLLFLDCNSPLLLGKCLRNHLAHGNTLLDVLLSDPSTSILLNAEKLVSENFVKSKKKVGQVVRSDLTKLKDKFTADLVTIINQEEMFAALEQGNLEELKHCIAKGADIHAKNINSWSALHFASQGLNLEVVKFVLDQNLDPNVKDENGQNPLHIAAASGGKNIVEFFIKKAIISPDTKDNAGRLPLHIATKNGRKDIVEILLQNDGDTAKVHDLYGLTPAHYAAQCNHVDIAELLLEKANSVDFEAMGGFTPLHVAAESGSLDMVNLLLSCKANVCAKADKGTTPLHPAALNGHVEVVKALISNGADVNARVLDGGTPLLHAVETGQREVVNILLKHGANPNIFDKTYRNTPLVYAAKDGHKEIVDALISFKADVNHATVARMTPLHFAVQKDHSEIVASLLEHGADIHVEDVIFQTPLHYAAEKGRKEMVEFLIQNGAEIDSITYLTSPLHIASSKGHKDIAALLIENKAGVGVKDVIGNTPLFAAAQNGNVGICELLTARNKSIVGIRNHEGRTALYAAAMGGHVDTIDFLIKNGADINTKDDFGHTPLHAAVLQGHKDVVKFLIENNFDVGASSSGNALVVSPLYMAIEAGFEEIVEILVANKADVNHKIKGKTPLLAAIDYGNRKIVEALIANGADVDEEQGEPLMLAIIRNRVDIMNILLENKAQIDIRGEDNASLLHVAAKEGHKDIVNALIMKRVEVNDPTFEGLTPLFIASMEDHEEIAEIFIKHKANVNIGGFAGTPLHAAAGYGHGNIVKLLLQNGAKMIKDGKSRSPLELAVANGHLHVVKILLQHTQVNMNSKGDSDWTLLHIASQEDNLEMVKYLVSKGCNIHVKNSSGSKPVHIAAREGRKDIVEFFLSKGSMINECGMKNQTLLHYAVMKNQLEMVKFLISKGAEINTKDNEGTTPLHMAALFGFKDTVVILLENGAIYNPLNNRSLKPIDLMNQNCEVFDYRSREVVANVINKDIVNLFASIEKLFQTVKDENSAAVENAIKSGAFVNAKNADTETTPLHYAAWKGCVKVVDILLESKANPNAVCSKNFTPLHYAAKFSKFECVKALLCHGAIYNPLSDNGKTPLDYASDVNITDLLKLIDQCFKTIKNGSAQIIGDLKKIKVDDAFKFKAIMNACNREKRTLIAAAPQRNSEFVNRLMNVSDDDGTPAQINEALVLLSKGIFQPASSVLNRVFNHRKRLLGPNNLATLDSQKLVAKALYKQGHYQTALDILEKIFLQQKEMLGLKNEYTLETRSSIALIFHRQGRDTDALDIFKEVDAMQNEILGSKHPETVNTRFHMALVLHSLGKYKEALRINKEVFEHRKNAMGPNNLLTVMAQNNVAMVLASLGEYEESLKIYNDVFQQKKSILGIGNADTLRTLHSIGGVLSKQNKLPEALTTFKEVLNIQRKTLSPNHPETLITQYNLACTLMDQRKFISAFKNFKECYDQRKAIFGSNHPSVIATEEKIKIIMLAFKVEGQKESEIIQHLHTDINVAVSGGDACTVKLLLEAGVDVNETDIEGRTPLHYAVNNEHLDIVNILLKNGADITHATNKGNTPLHTATSKRNSEIVDILLQRVSRDKLNDFVNAKTTSGCTTSLHVAAKNGSLDIVKSLLNHGAIYDVTNKEGKTPINLSTNQKITNLLKLIDELFDGVKRGRAEATSKLKAIKSDEISVITNSRNSQGNKLLQVALANNQKNIANIVLEKIKSIDQNY